MSPQVRVQCQPPDQGTQETVVQFSQPTSLNEAANQSLGEQLDGLVNEMGPGHLLLDFANVGYLTSSTLSLLTALHHKLRSKGSQLRLRGLQPHLYEIFAITRLNTLLDIRQA